MGNSALFCQKCGKKQQQLKKNHLKLKQQKIRKYIKKNWQNIKNHLSMQISKLPMILHPWCEKYAKKFGITAKGKKGKFPNDPKAPKRAPSGFFLFSTDNRPRVQKECGNSVAAVGKQLGQEWKSASADVKAKYNAKAEKGKASYQKELAKYQKSASYKKFAEARAEFNKMKKKM